MTGVTNIVNGTKTVNVVLFDTQCALCYFILIFLTEIQSHNPDLVLNLCSFLFILHFFCHDYYTKHKVLFSVYGSGVGDGIIHE